VIASGKPGSCRGTFGWRNSVFVKEILTTYLVQFFWDPTNIGWLVSSSPQVRMSAVGPGARFDNWFNSDQTNKLYFTTRVGNERIFECINLGQAWSGGKGEFQFKSTESWAMDAASKIKDIIKFRASAAEEKIPKLQILQVMRPSVEMDSLVGGFDVYMAPQ
jgi:hypothetical protein